MRYMAASNGEDLQSWRRQISQYDQQLSALRSDSKQLVLEVRGVSSNDVNYVFPSYLVKYVPAGVLGLMIAVIFAAAMSSLDSELTALSSATIVDFYRRYLRREASSQHYLMASRVTTLFWGVLASGFALYAGQLGSLIEAVNRVGSYFYGSLLGVFLLAFLVKRANGNGAFAGLLAGMLAVYVVSETTDISFLYYNVVGAVVVVAVGTLWSLPTGTRSAA